MMFRIKGNVEITCGHGFTLLDILIWMLSLPVVFKLDEVMRELADVEIKEGKSDVKLNCKTRIERENKDMHTLKIFFSERFVFDSFFANTQLKIIATGLVSPSNVIVQDSFTVGTKIIEFLCGQNPLTLTIKKKRISSVDAFKLYFK